MPRDRSYYGNAGDPTLIPRDQQQAPPVAAQEAMQRLIMSMLQEQGVPLTQQNVQRAAVTVSRRPEMRPAPMDIEGNSPEAMTTAPKAPPPLDAGGPSNVVENPEDAPIDTEDMMPPPRGAAVRRQNRANMGAPADAQTADGGGNAAIPGILASLGVTAGMIQMYRNTGTTGDPTVDDAIRMAPPEVVQQALDGEILGPEGPNNARIGGPNTSVGPAQSDVDVKVNPPRTDNALPAPTQAQPAPSSGSAGRKQIPSRAPAPEDMDVSADMDQAVRGTPAPTQPQLPEGAERAPQFDSATQPTRLIDSGQRGPNGELIFRDADTKNFVAKPVGGEGYISAPTMELIGRALRGAL